MVAPPPNTHTHTDSLTYHCHPSLTHLPLSHLTYPNTTVIHLPLSPPPIQVELRKSEKNDKKAAIEAREQLVTVTLSPYLYCEYVACKDYTKMYQFEQLTKASIVALNSRDIAGMNRLACFSLAPLSSNPSLSRPSPH